MLARSNKTDELNIKFEYFDGYSTSMPDREKKSHSKFLERWLRGCFWFSCAGGGVGLNLTAADYVCHRGPAVEPGGGAAGYWPHAQANENIRLSHDPSIEDKQDHVARVNAR